MPTDILYSGEPWRKLYVGILSILTFTLVWTAPLDYTKSDSELTLLTSQALVQEGNINLQEYRYALPEGAFAHGEWKYSSRGEGTIYYTYPLGNSVFAIPFVAVANAVGLDMSLPEHDTFMQRLLAGMSLIMVLLALVSLLKLFMPEPAVLMAAPLMVFSTSLFSTLGTALWSFNLEILFLLLSFREVLATETGASGIRPVRLGIYLAMAWFCRPSAVVFAALVFIWLFWKHRSAVLKVAGPILVFLLLFVAFSSMTYQQVLPPYYNPFFWTQTRAHPFGLPERLLALLFSPARGLFLFTPLLILGLAGLLIRDVRNNAVYRFSLVWFILQWLATGSQSNWWGGWCFGPRMMTESVIPLSVMLVMTWNGIPVARAGLFRLACLLLGGAGLFIHTYQGAFNKESHSWNDHPNIDQYPSYYMWNWKRSQLTATVTGNRVKSKEFELGQSISWMVRQLPKESVLLYGQPDPEVRSFLKQWNSHDGIRIFNSLYDVFTDPCDTFWVTEKNISQVSENKDFTVVKDTAHLTLGAYLRSMEAYTVVLVVKDEASTALSPQTRAYLRSKGTHIDSLKYRQGYALCFDKGNLVQEVFEYDQPATGDLTLNGQRVTFFSSGMDRQNRSSILLNAREYSLDRRGFNILVFDEHGTVVDIAWFDTLWWDDKAKTFFRVVKQRHHQNRK